MRTIEAKTIAKHWITDHTPQVEGFIGAYLTGSTIWKSHEELHALGSDVDIFIVTDSDQLPAKIGKINYKNLILEINYIKFSSISNPNTLLADYHKAGAFYKDSILLDPHGKLTTLHDIVKAQFTQPKWLIKRCQGAQNNANNWLKTFNQSTSLHDQITALFFAAGVTTHMLLVADLQNPTIRRRYIQCKKTLKHHNQTDFHETLLTTLGSHNMSPQMVSGHLHNLDRHFKTACQVMTSPYAFAADMNLALKSIAIDGTQDMIDEGHHREAVFWLLAIFCRSRAVIFADGSHQQLTAIDADLWCLLNDLGINNVHDMTTRAAIIKNDIAATWKLAQKIIG